MTSSNGKTYTVHKTDAEGTLMVDALTGRILTDLNERPDWSEGYAAAVVQERLHFYESRLGKDSDDFKGINDALVVNADDLGWVGVNAEQEEVEFAPSDEFRMDTLSKLTNVDRETGDMGPGVVAEREVSRENRGRTQAEINALESSVQEGFSGSDTRKNSETERNRATGG